MYVGPYPYEVAERVIPLFDHEAVLPNGPYDDRITILKEALHRQLETVWALIGNSLLESNYRWPFQNLGWARQSNDTSSLFNFIPTNQIMAWVREHGVDAARVLADFVNVAEVPMPSLARQLLIEYGDDEQVRDHINPLHRGFSWTGRLSDFYRGLLDIVQQWTMDSHPTISNWAYDFARELESKIAAAQIRDDEENLFL